MTRLHCLVLLGWLGTLVCAEQAFAQGRRYPAGAGRDVRSTQIAANDSTAQRLPPAPRAPFPPLPEAHQKYLDDVLNYWEHSSKQIERYRCQFTRWEYDPVFGPAPDPKTGTMSAKTIATGIIKYAAPDKGLYEVEKLYHYVPPQAPGGKPQYVVKNQGNGEDGEKWICDGESIYEFDFARKQLRELKLPPEMRGNSISEGPLPFMFGAKADEIKQRYWIRVITPQGQQGEYWLEAWPKRREDATNFKKIEIIIDEKDFLPKGIQIFDVNFDPRSNPKRTAFTFEKREINVDLKDKSPLDPLGLFGRDFHRPKTPSGWERVELKFGQPASIDDVEPRADSARRPLNSFAPR